MVVNTFVCLSDCLFKQESRVKATMGVYLTFYCYPSALGFTMLSEYMAQKKFY